eukprot:scpid102092/ scgid5272/ 
MPAITSSSHQLFTVTSSSFFHPLKISIGHDIITSVVSVLSIDDYIITSVSSANNCIITSVSSIDHYIIASASSMDHYIITFSAANLLGLICVLGLLNFRIFQGFARDNQFFLIP